MRIAECGRAFGVVMALLLSPFCVSGDDELPNDKQARARRLQFMKQTLDQFELTIDDDPDSELRRRDEPALRWTNPVRNSSSDGATFLWLAGRRPVVAAGVYIRPNGQVGWELTSLSDKPLRCLRDSARLWTPRTGGLLDQTLQDAPAAASSARLRLVQMRRLAGRFDATLHRVTGKAVGLRLLRQPLYRYKAETLGIVDGAVFAFALTNDPEVLLRLELHRADDGRQEWRYSLARMTAIPVAVDLDEEQVWSVKHYYSRISPPTPNDPYIERVSKPETLPGTE